jgi:hypothetical protein
MKRYYPNQVQVETSADEVNERRLDKHRPVARALRGGAATDADEVITLAHEQIALWVNGRLCSQDYIDAWKELLKHPQRAVQILEERSSRSDALRQNSPFVASVRKFEALACTALDHIAPAVTR